MIAVLYLLIGFGIFGTIMMMVAERTREMGVMVAIGMQKTKLASILFFETVYIGIIGVLAGFAGSIPLIAYYYNNPISTPIPFDSRMKFLVLDGTSFDTARMQSSYKNNTGNYNINLYRYYAY